MWSVCFGDGEMCWFDDSVKLIIGDGSTCRFWKDKWIGVEPLKNQFIKLFYLSVQKNCRINEMGSWQNGLWNWKFKWRRELSVIEKGLMDQMLQVLQADSLKQDTRDAWQWLHESDGRYTVSSAYQVLLDSIVGEDSLLFNRLWSGVAPSNVVAFVWKVLIDRVQSKANLRRRNIITNEADARCSICNDEEESTNHLFFSCPLVLQVWSYCHLWLGVSTVLPRKAKSHLPQHELPSLTARQNDGFRSIWMAAVWSIWAFDV